ncbi:response regulator transcription factor EsaR [Burkholderia gladioli]|jgi:DNA-binding NtrC family response regulator|uniref:Bacterial regulatory, Fis family protein n=2 Tax=Burkholderia gladioli TaxID=28095 RepID=A0AAP8S4M0_BURGA|nr:response regulator transcription factor EsaR [Burkholderia gladioli]AEA62427.1 Two component transcriptional regulator, Fis family protein [Burkholderia gladioli BSR3]AJW97550.1 bacterial regulatory, Fis family protein [Burkholderia gladioli]ASD81182.1 two-component system response regulator [Burkholderia gladioli pv. gladioli]AWY53588.1 two-component system response regulator [Burkholderia gladioli pv. gladioli]KAF1063544.1 Regulatory protein AtoC [Burkholderia gladioli]
MATILVVDDEMGIRELLSEILADEGHVVEVAENAQAAREYRQRQAPDLVLLDIWMPDTDGVTLLKEWASHGQLTMPVIMMSGHATIDTAVEATKIGALDFLEKPIALQKLLKSVEHGLARGAAPVPQHPAAKPAAGPTAVASAAALPVLGEDAPTAPGLVGQTAAIPFDIPLREARDAFERAYFEYHLARENGSMTRVAEKTGLERTHLYRKLKQLGVELGKKPTEGGI